MQPLPLMCLGALAAMFIAGAAPAEPLAARSPASTQDCTPGNPSWVDDRTERAPFVLLDPAETGGNANGPGCDGCTVWASGIVIWGEDGYGAIFFPDGARVGHNITNGQVDEFGGGTYDLECGESAEWDFVSSTSGGQLAMKCSKCE